MSQATNKEVDFSSQQHFQLFRCLMPHRFHCRLNVLLPKIKTEINLTLAAFVIYSYDLTFCVAMQCVVVGRRSLTILTCESYNDKKSSKKGKD